MSTKGSMPSEIGPLLVTLALFAGLFGIAASPTSAAAACNAAQEPFEADCGEVGTDLNEATDGETADRTASHPIVATPPSLARTPRFIAVGDTGPYVRLTWQQDTALEGVIVYRDGDYVTTVDMPTTAFNDRDGTDRSLYQLVGFDSDGNSSEKSPEAQGRSAPRNLTVERQEPSVVEISWDKPSNASQFYVYKDNLYLGETNATEFVDGDAEGNRHKYTVVARLTNGRTTLRSLAAEPYFDPNIPPVTNRSSSDAMELAFG